MTLIYLDACVLIDAREKQTPEAQAIVDLLAVDLAAEAPFVTSDLSLLEVLVRPIRGLVDRFPAHEDAEARSSHDWYRDNLTPDSPLIRTLPVTRDVLIQAAIMRARQPTFVFQMRSMLPRLAAPVAPISSRAISVSFGASKVMTSGNVCQIASTS